MKNIFIMTAIFSCVLAWNTFAGDMHGDVSGEQLISKCQQEATDAGTDDTGSYVTNCIDDRMGYEKDE